MAATLAPTRWVIQPTPRADARLRLFCFPNAGGGASGFRPWAMKLPSELEVCLVQLPGRETRMREAPFQHVTPLVEALVEILRPYYDKPFALFGHSMGALIIFELARALRRQQIHPTHLFVSARSAPQLPLDEPIMYQLPEPEFIAQLRHLNGTAEAVLQDPELMSVLLPLLRADFSVNENYTYVAEPPLDIPISAFGGLEDRRVKPDSIRAWAAQTTQGFKFRMLPGDHFFLHSAYTQPRLLQAIAEDLL